MASTTMTAQGTSTATWVRAGAVGGAIAGIVFAMFEMIMAAVLNGIYEGAGSVKLAEGSRASWRELLGRSRPQDQDVSRMTRHLFGRRCGPVVDMRSTWLNHGTRPSG